MNSLCNKGPDPALTVPLTGTDTAAMPPALQSPLIKLPADAQHICYCLLGLQALKAGLPKNSNPEFEQSVWALRKKALEAKQPATADNINSKAESVQDSVDSPKQGASSSEVGWDSISPKFKCLSFSAKHCRLDANCFPL